MNQAWALQDAKNRLSAVVEEARAIGPQTITRHGKEVAVVVSIEDFRRLTLPQGDLVSFLGGSPLHGLDIDVSRSPDSGRRVEL